jgi:RNA polymerase sigma factor (sigma-70 family)
VDKEPAIPRIDDLLFPFLNAHNEAESEAILEQLVLNHAQPLIRDIISFKLRANSSRSPLNSDHQEVEDISSDVIVKLVGRLRHCKSSPRDGAITSLRSYVATMAYNASDQYLRQKYPRRFSLKNRLRYIVTHRPGLALWDSEGRDVLCGFSAWRQLRKTSAGSLSNEQFRGDLDEFLRKRFGERSLEQVNPADLVGGVFEFAGAPLEIDGLVTVMAEIWGIRDAQPQSPIEGETRGDHTLSSSAPLPDAEFDRKENLNRVWNEILLLPIRQRTALLLNLRDEQGGTAMSLLPMLRVASIQQIGTALEMKPEEIAELWNELPLDDSKIGEKLGATRQQVANLRKCARERLSRRIKAVSKSR